MIGQVMVKKEESNLISSIGTKNKRTNELETFSFSFLKK